MAAKITVIGLGPGDPRKLTLEAAEALQKAGKVYVRTVHHPTVSQLPEGLQVESFDSVYDQAESFDQTYASIASRLIALALQGQDEVFYAVPGDPMVGEASVRLLLEQAASAGVEVRIISGMSFVEPVLRALGVDPLNEGLQLVDGLAFEVEESNDSGDPRLLMRLYPPLQPTVPALISQIYNQRVASAAKLALLEIYLAEHEVAIVRNAGLDSQTVTRLPLYEIDRAGNGIDHLTVLYVPSVNLDEMLTSFRALEWIIARLRGPGGCPWDQEQTHQSLKPHLIEETYEVVEALDSGEPAKLSEELGDLLLQVV
ncbi:MAG: SAM-dependent methyltransferase, partial [Chloroflexi bacterium]|nr:SAM-dependent methyltransferase [Chloroflexota bacterium]